MKAGTRSRSNRLQRQPSAPRRAGRAGASAGVLQRALAAPDSLQARQVLQLQRTVGNRATQDLLQAKLTLGPANDTYEREADQVARQVVRRTSTRTGGLAPQEQTVQRMPLSAQITPIGQRQMDEDELQAKRTVQRQGLEEDELQAKRTVQRQDMEDEELQAKRTVQRQDMEDEELQAKRTVQRQEMEDEELQAKRTVQRQEMEDEELQTRREPHGPEGGPVSGAVEEAIQAHRGGGRPLDEPVRRSMETAFGADFSRVRVHTGGQSDALNQSLQAKAFTTGQDIFFRSNEYSPGSRGGQELLAHELTHVVQQNGAAVQPKRQEEPVRRAFRKPHPAIFRPEQAPQVRGVRGLAVQRDDDEKGVVGKAIDVGDIGGAIVEVYEAYNGDESASTIVKAITELSGNLADTTGATEDLGQTRETSGVGMWSRLIGGVTSMAAKGSELVGTLAGYGKDALEYASSFGYGADYLQQSADAVNWIGGWAKSASDLINPYKYYTDLIAASTKAANGITDGWNVGYVLEDLHKLARGASTRDTKQAAELIFNIAWWKRLEGYSKGAVGAIEGSATVFLGPLSKGVTTVATKSYETGWASYLLRAMGSTFTKEIYSNAQVKQQADADADALTNTIRPIVATGKLKEIVDLCKAAVDLGMTDFAKAIFREFDQPPSGKEQRYESRKGEFIGQAQRKGFAGALGI